ncbi:hypothetical protein [Parafilimonas sp.]|uniref:hypothetical protein n=1 Tax=Parafilimonas sp. TaxID=1969739 RepID=UPI0039E30192
MRTLTEQQWNEIYDDIYKALLKALPDAAQKEEDELKQIMEEIKSVLTAEEV